MTADVTPPSAKRTGGNSVVIWLGFALVAGAGLLALTVVWPRRDSTGHPAIGQPIPTVELESLTGNAAPITTGDLQGKVTLLNFWGPWCQICRSEMPHLMQLREKYADEPAFQLLLVSCDGNWLPHGAPAITWTENLEQLRPDTRQALAKYDAATPCYVDTHGRTREALAQVAPWQGYPTTLLIDAAGAIRGVWVGYVGGDEHQIESQLRGLLREMPTE